MEKKVFYLNIWAYLTLNNTYFEVSCYLFQETYGDISFNLISKLLLNAGE